MKNSNFEFSKTVDLKTVSAKKVTSEEVEANESELKALIGRLEIKDIKSLKGVFKVKKIAGGNYFQVDGHVKAELVQSSIVSMKDVNTVAECEFDAMFTLDSEVFNVDDSDSYEEEYDPYTPINKGILDIGELAVQHISLEIDRYPKLEGEEVEIDKSYKDNKSDSKKNNPFSVLADLKGE